NAHLAGRYLIPTRPVVLVSPDALLVTAHEILHFPYVVHLGWCKRAFAYDLAPGIDPDMPLVSKEPFAALGRTPCIGVDLAAWLPFQSLSLCFRERLVRTRYYGRIDNRPSSQYQPSLFDLSENARKH